MRSIPRYNTRVTKFLYFLALSQVLIACSVRQQPAISCDSVKLAIDAVTSKRDANEAWGTAGCASASRTIFDTTYQKALSLACQPQRAWQTGRIGGEKDPFCSENSGRTWMEAYELGVEFTRLNMTKSELEQALREAELAQNTSQINQINSNLRQVIRELEAITGAGQVRGWINP